MRTIMTETPYNSNQHVDDKCEGTVMYGVGDQSSSIAHDDDPELEWTIGEERKLVRK